MSIIDPGQQKDQNYRKCILNQHQSQEEVLKDQPKTFYLEEEDNFSLKNNNVIKLIYKISDCMDAA